jgi:hypothetical protein
MPTLIKGTVLEGDDYSVSMKNTSPKGTVVLTVGWVPDHGGKVPDVETRVAAPNATVTVSGKVPAGDVARRLTVLASLDPNESAHLEVESGGLTWGDSLGETTVWEMVVDKEDA